MSGSGLSAYGVPDGDALREALVTCDDPLEAIEEFQNRNGVNLPSLRPALHLLDLHGISRADFHSSLLERLTKMLINQIESICSSAIDKQKAKQLNLLLDKCFPAIELPRLRPVVNCLLQNMPKIRADYLAKIVATPHIYNNCPVQAKRKIWLTNPAIFRREVHDCIEQYLLYMRNEFSPQCKLVDGQLPSFAPETDMISQSSKIRRQNKYCVGLVEMVGTELSLYEMVIQLMREFDSTEHDSTSVFRFTLRQEFAMSLHDKEQLELCNEDEMYKFVWSLDAGLRENCIDARRADELNGFVNHFSRAQTLADAAMILADPFTVHTLTVSLFVHLDSLRDASTLPRDDTTTFILYRLLSMGLLYNTIGQGERKFEDGWLNPEVITCLLGALAADMTELNILSVANEIGSAKPKKRKFVTFDAALANNAWTQEPVMSHLLRYYALHLLRLQDIKGFTHVMRLLLKNDRLLQTASLECCIYLRFLTHQLGAVYAEHAPPVDLVQFVIRHVFASIHNQNQLALNVLFYWLANCVDKFSADNRILIGQTLDAERTTFPEQYQELYQKLIESKLK